MIWLGIDPGIKGAVAALDREGSLLWCVDMPVCATGVDGPVLRELLMEDCAFGGAVATVEHQIAMPRQGVKATAKQHYGYGLICGVLDGLGITRRTVEPRIWQRTMTKGFQGGAKQRSMSAARTRWPEASLTGPRGAALDGRADALNLAEYGRLTWGVKL